MTTETEPLVTENGQPPAVEQTEEERAQAALRRFYPLELEGLTIVFLAQILGTPEVCAQFGNPDAKMAAASAQRAMEAAAAEVRKAAGE